MKTLTNQRNFFGVLVLFFVFGFERSEKFQRDLKNESIQSGRILTKPNPPGMSS